MLLTRAFKHHQRGWVGLVVMLIALAIVAFLAKDALKQYGLLSGVGAERASTAPAERQRNPGLDGTAADGTSNAPATPIERARGLEDTIKRQTEEQAKRMP